MLLPCHNVAALCQANSHGRTWLSAGYGMMPMLLHSGLSSLTTAPHEVNANSKKGLMKAGTKPI